MRVLVPELTELQLYREMLRIRRIEEAIAERYHEQQMRCPVHLSIGQEAVPVGVCAVLQPEDLMLSTHRAHAHYLAKGGSLRAMIAELYGKQAGCTRGKGGSMHLIDLDVNFLGSTPIVGSSFPVAAGAALASKMQGDPQITVVFLGDGMAEEGVFSETLNFAALKRLPLLFVCENNMYSVYSDLAVRQPPERHQWAIAEAHGIGSARGDGNCVEDVVRLSREAVRVLKEEKRPFFLEFTTYRWREHCGPNYDNHIGYRSEAEFLQWKERCPLEYTKERLHTDSKTLDVMETEIAREIEGAFDNALLSPFPPASEMEQHLYAP